jgi:protoporphyrinogen oxidase
LKKVTVIGSGITGLSVARMLHAAGNSVQILEKENIIGGLIKCERVKGNLFHKVGGHVFNSKSRCALEWFWSHFNKQTEFVEVKRNAKILMGGRIIGYPIENHLHQLSEDLVARIVADLLDITRKNKQILFENFDEFLIGNFGQVLYEIYFQPYNSKIWNTDLKNVALEWLDGKLPMPNIPKILQNNILRAEESEMVHSTFWYPVKDGSQFIVNRLSEGLDIRRNFEVHSVIPTKHGLVVNDSLETENIIYTGDVRKLEAILKGVNPALHKSLTELRFLRSNGTSNVLCETDPTDISWLYVPEPHIKPHRIIYTGNFSPTNNNSGGRSTCVVEFSGLQDEDKMRSELKKLPGGLVPLAFNFEPNSYVVQQKFTRDAIESARRELLKYNIYLLGRFAEWEYYNMDACIDKALWLSNSF